MQARHIPTYREPPTLRSLPIRSSVPFQLRERRVLLPQRLERPHRARERREPAPAHYERPDQRRRGAGEKAPKPPRPITALPASTNPTLPTEPFHPPPPKHCPCTPDLTQSNGKFASHPAAPATPPAIAVAAAWLTPRSRLYTKHAVSLIAYTGIKMNVPEPVHHVFKRGEEHRVEHALPHGVDAVP